MNFHSSLIFCVFHLKINLKIGTPRIRSNPIQYTTSIERGLNKVVVELVLRYVNVLNLMITVICLA